MKDKLKVGIAGARRGSSFIRPFRTIRETEVTAICDINEDTLDNIMDFTVPGLFSEESIANGGAPVKVPDFREIE